MRKKSVWLVLVLAFMAVLAVAGAAAFGRGGRRAAAPHLCAIHTDGRADIRVFPPDRAGWGGAG